MLRLEAGDDAVGGENVQHFQAFDDRRNQSVVAVVAFLVATGHVSIGPLESDEFAKLKAFHVHGSVSASGRKGGSRLDVDLLVKRPGEICAERVSASVVVEMRARLRRVLTLGGFGGHGNDSPTLNYNQNRLIVPELLCQ